MLTLKIYAQRYADRRHLNPKFFERLGERFDRTVHIEYDQLNRRQRVTNEDNEFIALAKMVEDPHCSTRQISQLLAISLSLVSRIICKYK